MTIKTFIKKLLRVHKPEKAPEQVRETVYEAETVPVASHMPVQNPSIEPEVDLSPQKDLENYAHGLQVSKKSLEQLISSGMLMPGELEVAEKIVRFMREKCRDTEH